MSDNFNDFMFQIHIRSMDVEILNIEERKRVGSSIYYDYGDQYIHVFGGMDIINYQHVDWYYRFDVNS